MMVLLVAFMKPPNLSIRGKLFCVFLQKTVTRKNTKKLVQALCQEHQIPLIKVDSNMKLANGQAFANLTKMVKPARLSNAPAASLKIGEKNLQHWILSRITSNHKSSNVIRQVIEINEL